MKKFVRTRGSRPQSPLHAPPPAPPPLANHKTNGHANGGPRRDDQHSTLSRYWSGSEECGAGVVGVSGAAGVALWEDADFPPARALGDKRRAAGVQWLRPYELCANPTFFGEELVDEDGADSAADGGSGVDGASGADGVHYYDELGADRWRVEASGAGALSCGALWRACAALRHTPRLLARAAPPHSFRRRYCGLFRFRFWVWSEWREVCVDDRLPARAGRLLASRAAARNDFTLPLLEKAYAKLYGSYAALRGCEVSQALQDVSGGVVQSFSLRQPRRLSFQVLNSAVPRSTLLVASAAHDAALHKHHPHVGLIGGNPYCVTGLARVRGASSGAAGGADGEAGALLRLRAAAGGAWRGAWSVHSAEYAALPAQDRDLLAADDDEFWMSFAEFPAWFSRLELVHVGPDDWLREPALHARRPWRAVLARRRWRRGYNAGGPPGAPTTSTNPQFHVQILGARKCHVVVAVAQQYAPASPRRLHAIGFAVYELPPGGATRPHTLAGLRPLDVTHESRAREVATFFTLPAGRYLVVPHTRRAHTDAAFLLRILTDDHTDVWELNEDNALVRNVWQEFSEDPRCIPMEVRGVADKMLAGLRSEWLDAGELRALLRRWWRALLPARSSLELCRALVALRDAPMCGRLAARELPALAALLAYWRHAFERERAAAGCGAPRCSAYRLRALLWAAGVAASNKVLECVVLRFARGAALPAEAVLLALARLHLAHERYRSLDTKMKSNPLSLEEMILMTIYS